MGRRASRGGAGHIRVRVALLLCVALSACAQPMVATSPPEPAPAFEGRSAEELGACRDPDGVSEPFMLLDLVTLWTNWYAVTEVRDAPAVDDPTPGHQPVVLVGDVVEGRPTPTTGVEIPAEDLAVVRDELAAGRPVLMSVNDALTHVGVTVVLAEDEQPAFVGSCAFDLWTVPLRDFAAEAAHVGADGEAPGDALRHLHGLIGPSGARGVAALERWLQETAEGPEDKGVDREVHPDLLDPAELAEHAEHRIEIVLPEGMHTHTDMVCLRSDTGWSECAMPTAVPAGEVLTMAAFARPGESIELWVYRTDEDPRVGQGHRLVSVPADGLPAVARLIPVQGVTTWEQARGLEGQAFELVASPRCSSGPCR